MAFGNSRSRRIASLVHAELAMMLRMRIDHQLIKTATISRIHLSPDCRNAKVFLTTPDQTDQQALMDALNDHAAKIRQRLAVQLSHLKYQPKLHFLIDTEAEDRSKLKALIASIPDTQEDLE